MGLKERRRCSTTIYAKTSETEIGISVRDPDRTGLTGAARAEIPISRIAKQSGVS